MAFHISVRSRRWLIGVTRSLSAPRTIVALLVGGLVTYGCVLGGVDAAINELARAQDKTWSIAWSAIPMLGGLAVPILAPLWLWWRGRREVAWAVFGAVVAALVLVTVLKVLTARASPEMPGELLAVSQTFRFGLAESGWIESIFEGWPSGHAATNAAMVWSYVSHARRGLMSSFAWGWLVWVALATVFGISGEVHWFSDSCAGLLIGWAIGSCWAVTRPPLASIQRR
ncbi:MAG: phosphatase PAP2 family protein [Pseudomonadota bacterium]